MTLFPFRHQLELSSIFNLLLLDRFFGHRARHLVLKFLGLGLILLILIMLMAWLSSVWLVLANLLPYFTRFMPLIVGVTTMALALWFATYLLEAYFRFHYFANLEGRKGEKQASISFDVGRFLFRALEPDLVVAWLNSDLGGDWLERLGITWEERELFLDARRQKPVSTPLEFKSLVDLPTLLGALVDGNPDFATWLLKFEVKRVEATGAARWIEWQRQTIRDDERWWTRDKLGRIPGLAKDWAYGGTPLLDEYSLDLLLVPETKPSTLATLWYRAPVEEVETILVRTREANALVVGRAGGALEVAYELALLIRAGRVFPELEFKHPKLLRTAILLSRFKERQGLEAEMVKIFNEVIKSGNIILVIDDLPSFITQASAMGVKLDQLLDPYLASNRVQVLALAELSAYHRVIEPNPFLAERFEAVQIPDLDATAAVERLIETVEQIESKNRRRQIFTYQALVALVDLGDQFSGQESATSQSLDFLLELEPWAARNGVTTIDKASVLKFATGKLNVPLGVITPEERDKLLNLEKLLHARVVGQDQAIVAIANALRRSRSGIRNLKRPIGSFLFLGPTGVGKTETAKTLADVFFGGEDKLLRLDMSEYRGPDALARLIGAGQSGEPGVLAKLLRNSPYGALLLDEFEKTEPEVLNLFLQILDEGFFSDMRGERVNARNIIFIATSNAGAPLIWEMVKAGQHLIETEQTIIDSLIKQGIFKPELLNRFDGVIFFNPLNAESSLAVGKLLLGRLAARLKEKGVILTASDAIVKVVVARGFDEQFGARPIARFIQDNLEQKIATALVAGQIKSGQEVTFNDNLDLIIKP